MALVFDLHKKIRNIYNEILSRSPTSGEMSRWMKIVSGEEDLEKVRRGLTASQELAMKKK